MEEAQSKSLAEARNARRQRKLDKLEIPEDHVAVTEELLGKGGFGEVYLADYNGRNAAAKVPRSLYDSSWVVYIVGRLVLCSGPSSCKGLISSFSTQLAGFLHLQTTTGERRL